MMKTISRRGLMLVLSSPSGTGKTTIANCLLKLEPELSMSVSATTRSQRPGEQDGRDYHFVTPATFKDMLEEEAFLEHAEVFGNSYGTPKNMVFDALSSGRDVIFDIDWQGTQQLAQAARTDLVSVFILPPSTAELEQRLRRRAQDTEETMLKRMSEAANEMSHWAEYDYVIINNDLDCSVAFIRSILIAERHKRTRQPGLADFVNQLRQTT